MENSEQAKEKCKECDGTGEILQKEPLSQTFNSMGECEKCNGTGYVEWIDNIIPKEKFKYKPFSSTTLYSVEINPIKDFSFLMNNIIAGVGIPKKYLMGPDYGSSLQDIIKTPEVKLDLEMTTINVGEKFDKTKVKEDETETCPKCNGSGLNCEPIKDPKADRNKNCGWCGGNGKVSWLDNIYKRPKQRGLKVKWSVEAAKDLKAFHGLDVEQELVDILSKEIEKEILEDICKKD